MDKQVLHNLLSKYLKGECSPDEIASVQEWFATLDTGKDDPRLMNGPDADSLQQKMLVEVRRRVESDATTVDPGQRKNSSTGQST